MWFLENEAYFQTKNKDYKVLLDGIVLQRRNSEGASVKNITSQNISLNSSCLMAIKDNL